MSSGDILDLRDGRFWRGCTGSGTSVVVFPGQFVLVESDLSVEEGCGQGGDGGRSRGGRRR